MSIAIGESVVKLLYFPTWCVAPNAPPPFNLCLSQLLDQALTAMDQARARHDLRQFGAALAVKVLLEQLIPQPAEFTRVNAEGKDGWPCTY